jgi:predicted aconitase with swiveling domain
LRIRGRRIVGGYAEGVALVTSEPISFYGGVDPETGLVVERGHQLEGESVRGRALIFPRGKGSTVGSYIIYRMRKLGTAPAAIINQETEAIIATGCVLAGIPLIDRLEADPLRALKTGDYIRVYGDEGLIEVTVK